MQGAKAAVLVQIQAARRLGRAEQSAREIVDERNGGIRRMRTAEGPEHAAPAFEAEPGMIFLSEGGEAVRQSDNSGGVGGAEGG